MSYRHCVIRLDSAMFRPPLRAEFRHPLVRSTRAELSRRSSHGLFWVALVILPLAAIAQTPAEIPNELPAFATDQLTRSLTEANGFPKHVWRDTPSMNDDGTVNSYVEISRGDRRKWEFRIAANARAIDRVIPEQIGGYPVNYGFVPQTISYDGDPFDVLVLGPPIAGGRMVRGVIVGLMFMDDEKGFDAKVVVSRATGNRPDHPLTEHDRRDIGNYFERYKLLESGKFSKVPGWGSAAEGLALVKITHTFFRECRQISQPTCRVVH
jgi:inorganic pyrophosphatase